MKCSPNRSPKIQFQNDSFEYEKNKTPDNHKIKGFLNRFGTVLVEPEGFEPSSKQAITMLSTCVVSAWFSMHAWPETA